MLSDQNATWILDESCLSDLYLKLSQTGIRSKLEQIVIAKIALGRRCRRGMTIIFARVDRGVEAKAIVGERSLNTALKAARSLKRIQVRYPRRDTSSYLSTE